MLQVKNKQYSIYNNHYVKILYRFLLAETPRASTKAKLAGKASDLTGNPEQTAAVIREGYLL